MDEVEKGMLNNSKYKRFLGTLSRSIDQKLADVIDDEDTGNANPISIHESKIERILTKAAEGASTLLRRLPMEKSTLRVMLNHDFPGPMRYQAWSMFLGHPEIREKYERAMRTSQMSTISDRDADITHTCQTLVDQEFSSVSLSINNPHRLIVTMKTALSYYHTHMPSGAMVDPQLYYFGSR